MGHRAFRVAALGLALALVGGGVGSQERDPVKIGLIYTNTGPLAQLGIDMRDGNLLYWSQVGSRAATPHVAVAVQHQRPVPGLGHLDLEARARDVAHDRHRRGGRVLRHRQGHSKHGEGRHQRPPDVHQGPES